MTGASAAYHEPNTNQQNHPNQQGFNPMAQEEEEQVFKGRPAHEI